MSHFLDDPIGSAAQNADAFKVIRLDLEWRVVDGDRRPRVQIPRYGGGRRPKEELKSPENC